MTWFVVCAESGAVLWAGACQPTDLALQSPPPGGAVVEITQDQFQAVRSGIGVWSVVDGDLVSTTPTPTLDSVKAAALLSVDRAAETARLHYITGGAGQALSYMRKEAEARAFVAPGTDADCPYLAAERDAQNAAGGSATLATVAAEVVALANVWTVAGANIERLRRGAKLAIAAATTADEVRTAAAVSWPTP